MSDLERRAERVQLYVREFDGVEAVLRRWAGCWIDFIVVFLLIVVLLAPFMAFGDAAAGFGVLAAGLAVILYYVIGEAVWGRTVGKLVLGLVIVNRYGQPPGIGKAIVRTLLRLIEVNPFLIGGVPAGICVLVSSKRQRLGDMAAGTYVLMASEVKRLNTPDVFS